MIKLFWGHYLVGSWIAIASFMIDGSSQTLSIADNDWVVNLPKSPIQIILCQNKTCLTFDNKSKKSVTRFKLGCVSTKKHKIKVLSDNGQTINKSLEPNDALNGEISSLFYRAEDIQVKKCQTNNAKVAVIEVTFADKSIWSAK